MPFLQIKNLVFLSKLVNKSFSVFGDVSYLETSSGGGKEIGKVICKLSCLVKVEILKILLGCQECQGNCQKLYSP